MTSHPSLPGDLSDRDLLVELERAASAERYTTARVIALLMEVDGRRLGIAGALASSHVFAALLFGVQPMDGATLVVVAATILLVSAVASGLPALRASRLDPNVVLRDD